MTCEDRTWTIWIHFSGFVTYPFAILDFNPRRAEWTCAASMVRRWTHYNVTYSQTDRRMNNGKYIFIFCALPSMIWLRICRSRIHSETWYMPYSRFWRPFWIFAFQQKCWIRQLSTGTHQIWSHRPKNHQKPWKTIYVIKQCYVACIAWTNSKMITINVKHSTDNTRRKRL